MIFLPILNMSKVCDVLTILTSHAGCNLSSHVHSVTKQWRIWVQPTHCPLKVIQQLKYIIVQRWS